MAWTNPSIAARHFEAAFLRVRPSVAAADRARYERVERNLREGMGALQALAVAVLILVVQVELVHRVKVTQVVMVLHRVVLADHLEAVAVLVA